MEFEDRIPKLIVRYLRGNLTRGKKTELNKWIRKNDPNKHFFAEATNENLLTEELRNFNKKDRTSRLNNTVRKIFSETQTSNKSWLRQMKRYLTAAYLIMIVGIAMYIVNRVYNKRHSTKTAMNNDSFKNDMAPGTEKAILTPGSTIQLNYSGNKKITDENGTAVNQWGAQQVYHAGQSPSFIQPARSYKIPPTLVLPDGSHEWLNAVSSIRFPSVFIGKERNAEITGEAYFEAAYNPVIPFKVKINTPSGDGGEAEVPGTRFNVNAHADEATIKTTLVEGKIKVSKISSAGVNSGAVLLKPGHQAQIIQGKLRLAENADNDVVLAWKNGLFSFNGANVNATDRLLV